LAGESHEFRARLQAILSLQGSRQNAPARSVLRRGSDQKFERSSNYLMGTAAATETKGGRGGVSASRKHLKYLSIYGGGGQQIGVGDNIELL